MADWKEMYLTLMRDTERAIRILTEAQRVCEELYLREEDPPIRLLIPAGEDSPAGAPETPPDSGEFPIFQEKNVDKPGCS